MKSRKVFDVAVLSVGFGNPNSVVNMFSSIGCNAYLITAESLDIKKNIDLLVLPGVGSFDGAIRGIPEKTREFILTFAKTKKPLLGICIGMHILFEKSEEGIEKGLSLIPGEVKRFDDATMASYSLPIPNVGWNTVKINQAMSVDSEKLSRFYFTHSYYAQPDFTDHIFGYSNYGITFASVVRRDNIFGVQFHPEKSNVAGQEFFKRLLAFCYE